MFVSKRMQISESAHLSIAVYVCVCLLSPTDLSSCYDYIIAFLDATIQIPWKTDQTWEIPNLWTSLSVSVRNKNCSNDSELFVFSYWNTLSLICLHDMELKFILFTFRYYSISVQWLISTMIEVDENGKKICFSVWDHHIISYNVLNSLHMIEMLHADLFKTQSLILSSRIPT